MVIPPYFPLFARFGIFAILFIFRPWSDAWTGIDLSFTAIFIIEVVTKVRMFGLSHHYCGPARYSNRFDQARHWGYDEPAWPPGLLGISERAGGLDSVLFKNPFKQSLFAGID